MAKKRFAKNRMSSAMKAGDKQNWKEKTINGKLWRIDAAHEIEQEQGKNKDDEATSPVRTEDESKINTCY